MQIPVKAVEGAHINKAKLNGVAEAAIFLGVESGRQPYWKVNERIDARALLWRVAGASAVGTARWSGHATGQATIAD